MAVTDQILQPYNDPNLASLQSNAQSAAQTASNYQSAAALLPSKLRDAIQSKLDYNKDIIAEQNKAMANYFSAPSTARSDYQNVWNPFDREKLVAQATSNAYAPYATLTDILGQRRGQINDIVSAGTGAFNAQVGAQQNAAQLARQSYMDALGMADKQSEIAKWGYEQTHKGGSGGGGGAANLGGLSQLLATMTGQGSAPAPQVPSPTEPTPTYIPASGRSITGKKTNSNIVYHSPGGQWVFDNSGRQWVPVVD